jgi:hypothetical protein
MTEGASPAEPAAANLLISGLWSLTSAPHAPSFTTPGQGQGPGIGRREVTRPGLQTRGRGHRAPALQPHLSSVLCPLSSDLWTPASTWWSQRGGPTRPHSELGRETPPRPGYCPKRGGRAGRRQVEPGVQRPEIRDRKIEADDRDQSTALGSIERRRPTAAARGRFAPAQPSVAPAVLRPPSRPASRSIGLRSPRVCPPISVLCPLILAGWSSPVARQAHNLKVAGSNPAPATTPSPVTLKLRGFPMSTLSADDRRVARAPLLYPRLFPRTL